MKSYVKIMFVGITCFLMLFACSKDEEAEETTEEATTEESGGEAGAGEAGAEESEGGE